MRILFSLNGTQPESVPDLTGHSMAIPCADVGTFGTSITTCDVQATDLREASNDSAWDSPGREGRTGHEECCLVGSATQIDRRYQHVANASMAYEHSVLDDGVLDLAETPIEAVERCGMASCKNEEMDAEFAQCEDCIHFDFLHSVISQSCLIGAAKPHRRHPTGRLPEIVAICSKKQSIQPVGRGLGGVSHES